MLGLLQNLLRLSVNKQISNRSNGLFGIYVHWPFCVHKCPYCDFNSHVPNSRSLGAAFDEREFVQSYKAELRHFAKLKPNETINSIFFGGGTPSLMSPQAVGAILDEIASLWSIDENVEITLEANPNSAEVARFKGYKAAGVNRISIGVQSLRDEPLKALGRAHSVSEAKSAVAIAQSIFERSSFDLIYARPEQSLEDWRVELNEALDMAAGHISLYQLTIEQGTRFFDLHRDKKIIMPNTDLSADFYALTNELCSEAGYPAYEISNHAMRGEKSLHNLLYWRYGEYVGIGPGAHGRLIIDDVRFATANEKIPQVWHKNVYANGHGLVTNDKLTWEEEGDELLLMGLRLSEGIDPKRFELLSGRSLSPEQIEDLKGYGFVEQLKNGFLRVTDSGFSVLDAVVADLAA